MNLLAALLLAAAPQEGEAARKILELIEQLGSDQVEQRQRATLALKAVPDAALPELRRAARERSGEIAARAKDLVHWLEVQQLLTPGLKKAFPELEVRLLRGERGAWGSAFFEFKEFDDPDFDELTDPERGRIYERALAEADSDHDRKEILEEVLLRPAPFPPAGVIALLSSTDAEVRGSAARALGVSGGPAAVAPLRKALADPVTDVQWRAAEALGRLKAREAAEDLKRLLSHPDALVAGSAAQGLGRMGARDAEPDLRALLKHENETLRCSTAYALSDLGVEDRLQLVGNLLRSEEFHIQLEASERLAAEGPTAVPVLRGCLKDRNRHARRLAAEALGKMKAVEATADLEALFADPDEKVRESAVDAIEDLNLKNRATPILPLLKDPAWGVRHSAARALGTMEAREAIPGLHGLLEDDAPYVRIAAARSLARLGDDRGVPVLLREAKDRHKLVQQVISLTALNALRDPKAWDRLRATPLASPLEGRTPRVLEKVCTAAALKLELSDDDSDMDESDAPWMERRLRVYEGRPILDVVEGIRGNGAYDFILEPDRLRVVPHSEAIRFWSDWWGKRPKK
jgi:HEAT repeat protein